MNVPRLRFLTYNIKAGRYHPDGLEAVAQRIEPLAPDIVALQEVDRGAARSQGADQPAWLAQRLGLAPAFGCSFTLPDGGEYGNALLSRWPTTAAETVALPQVDAEVQPWFRWLRPLRRSERAWRLANRVQIAPAIRRIYPISEPRSLLRATVAAPWGPLTVLVTHWGLQASERAAQAEATLAVADGVAGPLILAGDFNAAPDSAEIQRLRTQLVDAAQAVGLTGEARLTFPSGPRGARTADGWAGTIDYVFTRGLRPMAAEVIADTTRASDHQPLLVELRLAHDEDSGHRG